MDVQHDKNASCFYAEKNGQKAELNYKKIDEYTLDYYSTFVPHDLRNQGLAQLLTQYALKYARDNNFTIIPSCSYVQSYINRHSEYEDLLKI